jgi:hypothetical protein
MGAFKPRFEGISDDYYPLDCSEVIKYSLIVVFVIGGMLGIMIAFLFWVLKSGLDSFVVVWSIVFLAFILMLIILFYYGGRGRIK